MVALVESIGTWKNDEALKRFIELRDLPPDLQQEALEPFFRSASGELRQRAIRAGAVLLPEEAVVEYLRNEVDDVLRNAGLEMLKLRGRRAFLAAVKLLEDEDTDVVLQAVLVLDTIRDPRAWTHLRPLLRHHDTNIVQAVITAAGHLAGTRGLADLVPFLSADPWLQVAAVQALGDLRSTSAVSYLAPMLGDPFLQQFAADALARIGGIPAYRVLARHWVNAEHESDARSFLELLATMLTQFDTPPRDRVLRDAAERHLRSDDPATALAAAWCVLALGPAEHDGAALDLIAGAVDDLACPPAIASRSDLVANLIRRDSPLREWGYAILARFPTAIPVQTAVRLIDTCPPAVVAPLGEYLARRGDSLLAIPLLALWIERVAERDGLISAVRRHRPDLTECLARCQIAPADIVSLAAAMGASPVEIAAMVERLDEANRWDAVAVVQSRAVAKRLPWSKWLGGESREIAASVLARAASRTQSPELLPMLRTELAARPQRELVESVGDLRDAESVPILAALLQHSAPFFRALVFDALGRIGGAAARAVLRPYCTAESPDREHASRALAACASAADMSLLRSVADSSDLSVRLALITPLSSFPDPENARVLRRMLFDPSAAAAQKAQAALELCGGAA